ncbi:MAG: TolC family protein [Bacteroidales bacterium]|jgi:outer membrane protein TolC|nr:TolC family protein [Bacteroidales bacterium]
MKKLILSMMFLSAGFFAISQNEYKTVLQQIEANNTTLTALREQMKSQKLNNRTGIYPDNPEVAFNYLWGSPALTGNRTDVSVQQSFDFPTVYVYRSKIANLQNENTEMSYKSERMYLLLSAKQICIELIYYNALAKEYEARLQNAERIALAYKVKLEKGETNILENNKAQLNLTAIQTEILEIETEQTALLAELKRLNGGKDIAFSNNDYPTTTLPSNFDEWYTQVEAKSPAMQYLNGQIEINRQQVKLNRALGLPKFSAGYMSEKITGEHFQGVTVSMSIPLWGNKNNVKQAKAQVSATEFALEDNKMQVYSRLRNLYLKALTLQQNTQKVRQSLSLYGNEPLLKKALDAGEISLLNYLQEIEYYYEAVNKALETERDFELTVAELSAMEE